MLVNWIVIKHYTFKLWGCVVISVLLNPVDKWAVQLPEQFNITWLGEFYSVGNLCSIIDPQDLGFGVVKGLSKWWWLFQGERFDYCRGFVGVASWFFIALQEFIQQNIVWNALLWFFLLSELVKLVQIVVQSLILTLLLIPYLLLRQHLEYYYFDLWLLFGGVLANCEKQMRTILVSLSTRCSLKIQIENILDVGLLKLKTAYFIKRIFSQVLMLLMVEIYPNLNIIGSEWPNVEILYIPELINKQWRFTYLYLPVLVAWVDYLTSAFNYRSVLGWNIDFLRPVFPQIPRIRAVCFPFHNNLPRNHIIVDDLTLKLKLFNSIITKTVLTE